MVSISVGAEAHKSRYFSAIEKEIPELEMRYNKILQYLNENGIEDARDFLEQKMDSERERTMCEIDHCIEMLGV